MRPLDDPITTHLPNSWRTSAQPLAPITHQPSPPGQYDLYPAFRTAPGNIQTGFDAVAHIIAGHPLILIDGDVGNFWEHFRASLASAISKRGVNAHWIDVREAHRSADEIESRIEPFLGGDDPLFGTRFDGSLEDFVDVDELRRLAHSSPDQPTIVCGCGAALASDDGFLIYLDLPKNELQYRARAGAVTNHRAAKPINPSAMYKRFYFVDWPATNHHKAAILPRLDAIIDTQRPEEPAIMSGEALRETLRAMSQSALRARPWFEPGPWGGQWLKAHVPQAAREVPNYAWSFELIAPENGLLIESDGNLLEVSFDWLMAAHAPEILGDSADFFGRSFPIRFDYLDTIEGGNLSLQCHPRLDYTRQHFGESFTQDETYYILDCTPDATVYLGFRDDFDPQTFREALERSIREQSEVDVAKHVNILPARRHDLFLIPAGTIHCSGRGNLVLEISATPYIFTFKMYDWLRLNLDGKPRTLNIDRAFDNLDFTRRTDFTRNELISRPAVIAQGEDWSHIHLPTHPLHFYDVERYDFTSEIEDETAGSCRVMNLVEGQSVIVETEDGRRAHFNFAETWVIPAAAKRFRLINRGNTPAKVISALVKRDLSMLTNPPT